MIKKYFIWTFWALTLIGVGFQNLNSMDNAPGANSNLVENTVVNTAIAVAVDNTIVLENNDNDSDWKDVSGDGNESDYEDGDGNESDYEDVDSNDSESHLEEHKSDEDTDDESNNLPGLSLFLEVIFNDISKRGGMAQCLSNVSGDSNTNALKKQIISLYTMNQLEKERQKHFNVLHPKSQKKTTVQEHIKILNEALDWLSTIVKTGFTEEKKEIFRHLSLQLNKDYLIDYQSTVQDEEESGQSIKGSLGKKKNGRKNKIQKIIGFLNKLKVKKIFGTTSLKKIKEKTRVMEVNLTKFQAENETKRINATLAKKIQKHEVLLKQQKILDKNTFIFDQD
jgi:hypothetical protein